MRTLGIAIHSPRLDHLSGLWQGEEPVLVQALIPQPSIEALKECILNRLARLDEVQWHTYLPGPAQESQAGEP
jgi:hypothetical protein